MTNNIFGFFRPLFVVIDGIPQEDVGDFDANGLLSGSRGQPVVKSAFSRI